MGAQRNTRAACVMLSPRSIICRASVTCTDLSTRGRPMRSPRCRFASNDAFVRSTVKPRSKSTKAANMCNTSRPAALVVSILSARDRKPTPRAASACTVETRCGIERPSRSRRGTTSVSPTRNASKHFCKPSRSSMEPESTSSKSSVHPAALRASSCGRVVWSAVETRAYPIRRGVVSVGIEGAATAPRADFLFGRRFRDTPTRFAH